MSEPALAPDPLGPARSNLRETIKWLIAIFAGLAAAVVGGSPLTGLGSLPAGWRLWLACGAATVAVMAIFTAIYVAFRLLVARPFFLADIRADPSLKSFVEANADALLPPEYSSFDDFLRTWDAAVACLRDGRGPAVAGSRSFYTNALATITDIIRLTHYEQLRRALMTAGPRLFQLAAVATVALGVFAWSANPRKDAAASGSTHSIQLPGLSQGTAGNGMAEMLIGEISGACGHRPIVVQHVQSGESRVYEFQWQEPEKCRGLLVRTPAQRK